MEGLNKVTLIGNLGRDPELKRTASGTAVLTMSIATTVKRWDKETSDTKEWTDWHSATVWGKRAEGLSRVLRKGSRVYVEGSLRHESWEGKDGGKRSRSVINAVELLLLDGRNRTESDEMAAGPEAECAAVVNDDIPF